MNTKLIVELHADYLKKHDSILQTYGGKDGFVIDGKLWWDHYVDLIKHLEGKINSGQVSQQDFQSFYKQFGFGPKFYGITFVENGMERLKKAFLLLLDSEISAEQKIELLCENQESEYYLKGIGTNFVTLFLTTMFPQKFVQWNSQIDDALKILDAYPKKEKGESRAKFYTRVNKVCLEIAGLLKEPLLTRVDNILFCVSKGYVGKGDVIEKLVEKEVKEIEIPTAADADEESKHLEIMYYLVSIGLRKGYDVWVATNDRGKAYKGKKLADMCLSEIPAFADVATVATAKYIDVIWFKKFTKQPVRFFEIEHSTSVYSGLLRLNDVRVDYPISKATIVVPASRESLFKKQIERRTFKSSQLAEICDFMVYENVKKWHEASEIDSQFA